MVNGRPGESVADALSVGAAFGGYRIEGVAGTGGMGVVYRATELALARTVALKVIASHIADNARFQERFRREARAAASIDHPHVLPVYAAGEHDGRSWLSMRYIAGPDLRTMIHDVGTLEPGAAARLVAQVSSGLDAAHARGLIHRDVKPANILLDDDGHVYLADFGITVAASADRTSVTTAQGFVGSLSYAAPEQIRGETIDARADVYALGCVLYHLLAGSPPFPREIDAAILHAHLYEPAPPLGAADADLARFDRVIERALAKDPAGRYASTGELGRAALRAAGVAGDGLVDRRPSPVSPGETVSVDVAIIPRAPTRRASPARPLRRERRRRRWVVAAAALAIVVGPAALLLMRGDGARPPEGAVTMAVPTRISGLAAGGRALWLASNGSSYLARLDTRSRRLTARAVNVGAGTTELASGFGSLWVVNQLRGELLRVDPARMRVTGRVQIAGRPTVVAVAASGVWVGSRAGVKGHRVSQGVTRVDPTTMLRTGRIARTVGVQDIAAGFGAVWITGRRDRSLRRIDPRSGRTTTVARLRAGAQHLTVGDEAVWATMNGGRVARYNPGTGGLRTVRVGRSALGVVAGRNIVWVADRRAGVIHRLDPARLGSLGDLEVPDAPVFLAPDRAGWLWVASFNPPLLTGFAR